jgi:hypothetical protein
MGERLARRRVNQKGSSWIPLRVVEEIVVQGKHSLLRIVENKRRLLVAMATAQTAWRLSR